MNDWKNRNNYWVVVTSDNENCTEVLDSNKKEILLFSESKNLAGIRKSYP